MGVQQSTTKELKYMRGASVDPKLIKRIDAIRGEVPRSRVVERALSRYVEEQERKKNVVSARTTTITAG